MLNFIFKLTGYVTCIPSAAVHHRQQAHRHRAHRHQAHHHLGRCCVLAQCVRVLHLCMCQAIDAMACHHCLQRFVLCHHSAHCLPTDAQPCLCTCGLFPQPMSVASACRPLPQVHPFQSACCCISLESLPSAPFVGGPATVQST